MGVIVKNPGILGGIPVFRGTRVPIQALFDYLEGGNLGRLLGGVPHRFSGSRRLRPRRSQTTPAFSSPMRILIDECVDERLRNALVGHDSQTARYAGFAGLENGELLKVAEAAGF